MCSVTHRDICVCSICQGNYQIVFYNHKTSTKTLCTRASATQPLYNYLCSFGGTNTTILIGLLSIHNIEVLETHYDFLDILQFPEY